MRVPVFVVTGLSVIAGMVFLAVSGVRTLDTHEASLYERLGGEVGVEGVVDNFLANVAEDEQLGARIADADMDWLRAFLNDWVCEAGGPCHTDGKGRSQADEGAGFTDEAFDLVTYHFADAMLDAGIAAYEHFAAMRLFVDMLTMSSFGDG